MKNQVLPPCFTTAVPVPFASIQVSYTQWMVFGEHLLPVRSELPGPEPMKALFFSRVTWLTASATPELGVSTITSTPSSSYHLRAICEPTSGLFRWSPPTTSILNFGWWAFSKSSTAIFAAESEPGPPMSAYRLDMSESTPIFTRLPEICACAVPAANASAAAAARCFSLNLIVVLLCCPSDSHTQVLVQHTGLGRELGRGERFRDPAVLDHVVPVRERSREPEILLHEHDREAAPLEVHDDAPQRLDDDRGEALGDLVEEQEPGARAQDPRHGEHLLL